MALTACRRSPTRRLQQKIREHSPLCVGDRSVRGAAEILRLAGLRGRARSSSASACWRRRDYRISVLKPQSAFFERFGSGGLRALEELVQLARAREVLVLLDGKRGDIDTTGAAYAEGYFSATTTLRVDAMTTHLSGPRGARSVLRHAIAAAEGGVFVVVRSSNPEGGELQTARMSNGETVAQSLCREITARNLRQRQAASGRSVPWSARLAMTRTKPSQRCRNRSFSRRASARRVRRCATY